MSEEELIVAELLGVWVLKEGNKLLNRISNDFKRTTVCVPPFNITWHL